MKVVPDTSIIIAVLTNEQQKRKIIAKTKNVDLVAPDSLYWEIGNAFSAMFKRGRIDIDQAIAALAGYNEIPIRFVDIDMERSLHISNHFNIYAYDAYFVSCAEQERAYLMTLDNRLFTISKDIGIKILEV